MTPGPDQNLPVPAQAPASMVTFDDRAKALLSLEDYKSLKVHVDGGGDCLAAQTSTKMFELFLNGSTVDQIWQMNRGYNRESIQQARIRDRWDENRDAHVQALQEGVRDRVVKAHLEAADLVASMMAAANKRYGTQIKKYLQSGDVKDLEGVELPKNVNGFMKAIETLQKITGQDKKIHVKSEETLNVNLNTTGGVDGLPPDKAAQILSIIAEAKRKPNA